MQRCSMLKAVTKRTQTAMSRALLLLYACFASSTAATAESVVHLNVSLPVDEIAEVSGHQLKVKVGTNSFLALKSDSAAKVAMLYATHAELFQKLPQETVSNFLLQAARQRSAEYLEPALRTWLETGPPARRVHELLTEIAALPGGAESIEKALESVPSSAPSESVCPVVVHLTRALRTRLQERAPQVVYRLQFTCATKLEREATDLLAQGSVEQAVARLTAIAETFPDSSADLEQLLSAKNRLVKIAELSAVPDYIGLIRATKTLEEDSWLRTSAPTVAHGVLSSAATKALEAKDYANVLRCVAAIEFEKRSSRDHDLIRSALVGMKEDQRDVLLTPEVARNVRSFALKDDGIRSAYIDVLERLSYRLADRGEISTLKSYIEQLLTVRPDPSEENDRVRISAVKTLMSRGELGMAQVIMSDIETGIPLDLRARLVVRRAGAASVVPLVIGVMCLIGLSIVIFGRRSPVAQAAPAGGPVGDGDDEGLPRRFVTYSQGIGVSARPDEYIECLKVFHLDQGASLQQIKVAYRNAVKACHPDLNPNAGPAEADRFVALTKTYDRLLQLHAFRTGER